MSFHRLISVIRRLLGRERVLARCPVASARQRKPCCWLLCLLGRRALASASVLVSGDVTPSDNPFTLNINEGLPSDGNFVNPFEAEDEQTFFEGRHLDNNVADPLDDTNVNIPDIIVGQSAYGTLLISGESALRDQTLTIGGSGPRTTSGGGGGIIRAGTGVMRITGFGSLYNNDPTIIPPGLPANFSSKTPRPIDVGYDLYVGIAGTSDDRGIGGNVGGTGTLEISAGGRAEIQDAVVVGRDPNSTGYIVVDGFDSYLGSGGFEAGGSWRIARAASDDHWPAGRRLHDDQQWGHGAQPTRRLLLAGQVDRSVRLARSLAVRRLRHGRSSARSWWCRHRHCERHGFEVDCWWLAANRRLRYRPNWACLSVILKATMFDYGAIRSRHS